MEWTWKLFNKSKSLWTGHWHRTCLQEGLINLLGEAVWCFEGESTFQASCVQSLLVRFPWFSSLSVCHDSRSIIHIEQRLCIAQLFSARRAILFDVAGQTFCATNVTLKVIFMWWLLCRSCSQAWKMKQEGMLLATTLQPIQSTSRYFKCTSCGFCHGCANQDHNSPSHRGFWHWSGPHPACDEHLLPPFRDKLSLPRFCFEQNGPMLPASLHHSPLVGGLHNKSCH